MAKGEIEVYVTVWLEQLFIDETAELTLQVEQVGEKDIIEKRHIGLGESIGVVVRYKQPAAEVDVHELREPPQHLHPLVIDAGIL